jgi:hypothetical protein
VQILRHSRNSVVLQLVSDEPDVPNQVGNYF